MPRRYRYFKPKRSKIDRMRSGERHKAYLKSMGRLRCEVCGFFDLFSPPWGLLESHHVKPVSLGGSHAFDNRILLCPNHHALADRLSRVHKHICNSKTIMIALIKEHEFNSRRKVN